MKQNILNHIHELLTKAENEMLQLIQQTKESRDNDHKSSAGDKHETSRALTQHELDKYEGQLNKGQQQKNELSLLKIKKPTGEVGFGSLVTTNYDTFFISIGMGKITVMEFELYAISFASPIGMLLKGKKMGDTFQFQNKEYRIEKIE